VVGCEPAVGTVGTFDPPEQAETVVPKATAATAHSSGRRGAAAVPGPAMVVPEEDVDG
jgi:hypothetical protein